MLKEKRIKNVTNSSGHMTMKPNGTFKKIGSTDTPMYGPPKVLVCGTPPKRQRKVLDLLKKSGLDRFPVVFVTAEEESQPLAELLTREHLSGQGLPAGQRRAIILSGFTENELRGFLAALRKEKSQRPLLATLTPTSVNWTVHFLLDELSAEAEAMKNINPNTPTGNHP